MAESARKRPADTGRRIVPGTGRRLALACVAVAALSLAGCATQVRHHGYAPNDAALSAIATGDSRETVAAAVGRPSTQGLISGGDWFYVGSRWEQFAHRRPVEVDREVVAIRFDANDRVTNIERFGLEDGQVVTLSRRVTETTIRGEGLISQLLRNVGRFTADQFVN